MGCAIRDRSACGLCCGVSEGDRAGAPGEFARRGKYIYCLLWLHAGKTALVWYGQAAKAYYCVRARLREVEESMLNLYRTDAPVRLARAPSKDDTKIAKHN